MQDMEERRFQKGGSRRELQAPASTGWGEEKDTEGRWTDREEVMQGLVSSAKIFVF